MELCRVASYVLLSGCATVRNSVLGDIFREPALYEIASRSTVIPA